jgi:hypothetical protein
MAVGAPVGPEKNEHDFPLSFAERHAFVEAVPLQRFRSAGSGRWYKGSNDPQHDKECKKSNFHE